MRRRWAGVKRVFLIAPPGDDHSDRLGDSVSRRDETPKRPPCRRSVGVWGGDTRRFRVAQDRKAPGSFRHGLHAPPPQLVHAALCVRTVALPASASVPRLQLPAADCPNLVYRRSRHRRRGSCRANHRQSYRQSIYASPARNRSTTDEIAQRISNAIGKAVRVCPDQRRGCSPEHSLRRAFLGATDDSSDSIGSSVLERAIRCRWM